MLSRLYIARHGETNENANGIVQGHSRGTLSPRGLRQAALLAQRFASIPIDSIYSSDLPRARITAEQIALVVGADVRTDPRLREKCFGIYEGRPTSDYVRDRAAQGGEKLLFCVPGGETFPDLFGRCAEFMDELLSTETAETVLIVAHGGTNRGLIRALLRLSDEEALTVGQDNTCVNRFDFQPGTRVIKDHV